MSLRIDFNQKGSWRKGPDLPDLDEVYMRKVAEEFALMVGAKLRFVDSTGHVYAYWADDGLGWRETGKRGWRK